MENKVNRFLDELRRHLRAMPKEEREYAILEIKTHITEGIESGKNLMSILSDIGEPKTVAIAYLSDYHLQQVSNKKNIFNIILSSLFFTATGFISLAIVPSFLMLGLTFAACTVMMPVFGVMRTLGAEDIFVLRDNVLVPRLLAIPAGLFLGLLSAGLTCCFTNY